MSATKIINNVNDRNKNEVTTFFEGLQTENLEEKMVNARLQTIFEQLSDTGGYGIRNVNSVYTNAEKPFPVKEFLAAVSVGVIKEGVIADLCYEEDSAAIVDMNVVMTGSGEFVEVQGTGEKRPFSRNELNDMLAVAEKAVSELIDYQKDILGPLSWKVGRE